MTIELITRNVCVVAFDTDADEAQALLAPYGIACEPTPDAERVNVFLHPHRNTLAVCSADGGVIALVRRPLHREELLAAIECAMHVASLQRDAQDAADLLQICRALSAEPDLPALQDLILRKARELTKADMGRLFVVERRGGNRVLRLAVPQAGPRDEDTHVGAVALSGEALRIAGRAKSILCVPMRSYANDVVGVIELVNQKRDLEVEPFDERDERVALALAAHAGVVIAQHLREA